MKERPIIFNADMVRAILDGRKTQTRRIVTRRNSLFNGGPWSKKVWEQKWDWGNAFVDPGPSPAGNPGPYLKLPCLGGEYDFAGTTHRIYPKWFSGDWLWVREAFTYWECPDDPPIKRGARRTVITQEEYDALERERPKQGEDFICYKADGERRSLGEWPYPHQIYEHCIGKFGKTIPPIHMPRWASRITLEVTGVRVERLQDISEWDARAEGCDGPAPISVDPHDLDARERFQGLWRSINDPESWDANPWVWVIEFERRQP